MKVIFMGTPDFAVNTLEKIIEAGHEVMLVVTQPDKPKGRGNTMQFPPVKECAVSHGLEVFQPGKNPGRCKCGIFEKVCARYHHSGGFRADSSKEYSRSSEIRMH